MVDLLFCGILNGFDYKTVGYDLDNEILSKLYKSLDYYKNVD